MDTLYYVNAVLLWLHFFALVLGMGSGMALGVISPVIGQSDETHRPKMWALYTAISRNAHAGLGLLLLTGIVLVFTKYGGAGQMSLWFWIKMALVVVLVVSIAVGTRAGNRVKAGDASAMPVAARAGIINGITGILIILTAVLAFE